MSERIARLLVRRGMALILGCAVVAVLAAIPALGAVDELELGNGSVSGSPSESAAELIAAELGFDPLAPYVLLVETQGTLDDETVAVAIRALRSQIDAIDGVGRAGKAASSPSGAQSIAVYLDRDADTEETLEVGRSLRDDLDAGPLKVTVAGDGAVAEAARDTLTDEALELELIVLPFVVLVLVAALGLRLGLATLLGALLSGAVAVVGLLVLAAVATVEAAAVPVAFAGAVLGAIALAGALTRRYREEVPALGKGAFALAYALGIVGRGAAGALGLVAVVAVAALTLGVGILASIAAGALLGILTAPLALLPAGAGIGLGWANSEAPALPMIGPGPDAGLSGDAPRGLRAGVAVARTRRRAGLAVLPAAAVVLLAVSLLDPEQAGLEAGDLPRGAEARQADQALQESFGTGATGPLAAVVQGPADSPQIAAQREAIAGLDGVEEVSPAGNAAELARYTVIPGSQPRSLGAQRAVAEIRDLGLEGDPQLIGPAADLADTADRLDSRLAITAILALVGAAGLWALLFGRLTGAALAICAALGPLAGAGAVAWLFSEGWLEDLLGYRFDGAPDLVSPLIAALIVLPLTATTAAQFAAAVREERVLGGGAVGAVARSQALTLLPALAACACGLGLGLAWLGSDLTLAREVALGVGVGLLVEAALVRPLIAPGLARLVWR